MQPHDEDDIPADPSTLIRMGLVSAVQLKPPRIKMRYGDPDADDGDIETPWVRFLALRAGKTKCWSYPSIGEEGVLLAPDGQVSNGIFLPGLWNDTNSPPDSATADNDLTEYGDGALLGYDAATHDLILSLPGGGKITIAAPAGMAMKGDIDHDGSLITTGLLGSELGATGTFTSMSGQTVEVTNGLITNIF